MNIRSLYLFIDYQNPSCLKLSVLIIITAVIPKGIYSVVIQKFASTMRRICSLYKTKLLLVCQFSGSVFFPND